MIFICPSRKLPDCLFHLNGWGLLGPSPNNVYFAFPNTISPIQQKKDHKCTHMCRKCSLLIFTCCNCPGKVDSRLFILFMKFSRRSGVFLIKHPELSLLTLWLDVWLPWFPLPGLIAMFRGWLKKPNCLDVRSRHFPSDAINLSMFFSCKEKIMEIWQQHKALTHSWKLWLHKAHWIPNFWGIKRYKSMVILMEFPSNNALFGLVI